MADSALEKAVVLMLQTMQGPKNPSSPEAINAALGVADMVGIDPQSLMEGYNEFFAELKSTKEFTSPDSLRNYPSYQQMSRPGQNIGSGVPMTTEEGFNYMAPTSEEEADAVFARFQEFVAPMLQGAEGRITDREAELFQQQEPVLPKLAWHNPRTRVPNPISGDGDAIFTWYGSSD